ncbi:MAG: CHASE3 domain-containing protein [Gemmatimonadaceae bacterium]
MEAVGRLVRTTLWLALAPLIAIGLTGIGGFLALRQASEMVFYTREVLRVGRQVTALATDREAGIRGFLLTLDSASLRPEIVARAALPTKLDTLVALPRDSAQRVRALAVKAAVDRWDKEFARPVLASPVGAVAEVRATAIAAEPLFNVVRERTAEFMAAEDRLWAERVRRDRLITKGLIVAFTLESLSLRQCTSACDAG